MPCAPSSSWWLRRSLWRRQAYPYVIPWCIAGNVGAIVAKHQPCARLNLPRAPPRCAQVYVMLPLDLVSNDNTLHDVPKLVDNLKKLKAAGATGVMTGACSSRRRSRGSNAH